MYPELFTKDDRLAIARSTQTSLEPAQKRYLHFDPGTDVWYHRDPLPTGDFRFVPFIPSSAASVQWKIIADAHRAMGHRGPDLTLSGVTEFALERPLKKTIAFVGSCLHCQAKRAKCHTNAELLMETDRSILGPFQSVAMDHLCIGTHTHCLSVMCMLTGFLFLSACRTLSAEDTFDAFHRVLYRIPRRPLIVKTDKATQIFAKVVLKYQQRFQVPVEYRHTPAHSQFENGLLERSHASILSVLRSTLCLSKLGISSVENCDNLQLLLDSVAYTLNLRPVGELHLDIHSCQRTVISPSFLVYGPGVLDDVFAEVPLPSPPGDFRSHYVNWRSFYDGYYWKCLKSASTRAIAGRLKEARITFAVGERVLFFQPRQSKTQLDFRFGRVLDIRGNQLVISSAGGREMTISVHNACKLQLRIDKAPLFDVSRVGAKIQYLFGGRRYVGTVIREVADELLIRWDIADVEGVETGWPDEWLVASAVDIVQ